jgi:FkbM family methyltransferase
VSPFDLHGIPLVLTEDHALPGIREVLPDYGENIGRVASAVEKKYPGRGFVDVGANVGDTAVIVRAHSRLPILCIEGSDVYFDLLQRNVGQFSDVELDGMLVDAASGERPGQLNLKHGTAAFQTEPDDTTVTRFEGLEKILARHPRFQSAKLLKVDTDGMDGRIILGALGWISTARPILFWEHDIGRDIVAGGPAFTVFSRLFEIGYRTGIIFDNKGDYLQTLSLDAHQQLADLSDYLPGGVQEQYGYCDICAFHLDDMDLCSQIRQTELEARRIRRGETLSPTYEPPLETKPDESLSQAKWEEELAKHRMEVAVAVREAVAAAFERPSALVFAAQKAKAAEAAAELQRSLTAKEWECARLQHELKLEQIGKSLRVEAGVPVKDAIDGVFERLSAIVTREARKARTDEAAELQRSVTAKELECARLQHELKLEQMKGARRESELTETLADRAIELQACGGKRNSNATVCSSKLRTKRSELPPRTWKLRRLTPCCEKPLRASPVPVW